LAQIVGNDDLIENITKGNIEFDLLIATPNMMPKLGRIRSKRINAIPKSGTVTSTLGTTLTEFKGKFEYKADKTGVVHVSFGKTNLLTFNYENLEAYRRLQKTVRCKR
jgi:large subunit ribosomal protein L1